jgi:hypothetical protein
MWDVQFKFNASQLTGSDYLVGVGFDGTYFYCPAFASSTIYRFDKNGTYLDSFSISGVPDIIDLAYDGTYFYGQAQTPTNVIYKMDFTTHTLIGTIPSPTVAWNIAYDANHDGFWIGQWQNSLTLIDRSGNILDTITPPESMLGMAWDPWTQISGYAGPFLWIFTGTSTGGQGIIKVIDLATKTEVPGVEHNVALELGMGIAGGLELTTNYKTGTATLYGMIQGASTLTDYVFGYEIATTNEPPLAPPAPLGADTGKIGTTYTFQATTTDPEGDQIYYMFNWGDGTQSDWIGPFNSGTTGSADHAWEAAGTYNITAKAKDVNGGESGWSPAHTITIFSTPTIAIQNITGGMLHVKAVIKNTGVVDAMKVDYSITLVGGAFIGKTTSGQLISIPGGQEKTITSKPIFGFGKTMITVSASCTGSSDAKNQSGFVFLFFIKTSG